MLSWIINMIMGKKIRLDWERSINRVPKNYCTIKRNFKSSHGEIRLQQSLGFYVYSPVSIRQTLKFWQVQKTVYWLYTDVLFFLEDYVIK